MCAFKRIERELILLNKNPIPGIEAGPINAADIFRLKAILKGPSNSPYEDGVFSLNIKFPRDYPFAPPIVNFSTKILLFDYHYYDNKFCCGGKRTCILF